MQQGPQVRRIMHIRPSATRVSCRRQFTERAERKISRVASNLVEAVRNGAGIQLTSSKIKGLILKFLNEKENKVMVGCKL